MDEVKTITVIVTTLTHRGEGKAGDPSRVITQYWDMEGNLLWEIDPCERRGVIAFEGGMK
jgi:hypothetical protein